MSRKLLLSMLVVVFASVHSVSAAPILGFDMDPGTPGIQTTLSIPEGSSFSIDLVAYDDGSPVTPLLVDTVAAGIGITGSAGLSFGGATAGAFAGALGFPFDVFGGAPTGPGAALTAAPFLVPGATAFYSYTGVVPALLSLGPGLFDVLMSFSLTASTAGTSTFSVAGAPPGSELLFSGAPTGGPLFPSLFTGGLTVTPSTPPPPPGVPEPGTLALMAIAILGLVRRKTAK